MSFCWSQSHIQEAICKEFNSSLSTDRRELSYKAHHDLCKRYHLCPLPSHTRVFWNTLLQESWKIFSASLPITSFLIPGNSPWYPLPFVSFTFLATLVKKQAPAFGFNSNTIKYPLWRTLFSHRERILFLLNYNDTFSSHP